MGKPIDLKLVTELNGTISSAGQGNYTVYEFTETRLTLVRNVGYIQIAPYDGFAGDALFVACLYTTSEDQSVITLSPTSTTAYAGRDAERILWIAHGWVHDDIINIVHFVDLRSMRKFRKDDSITFSVAGNGANMARFALVLTSFFKETD